MKLFIINLFKFIIFIFLFDKLFLLVRYQTSEKEIDKRLELIEKGEVKSEILIFGSSLGARNIMACQIEKKLKKSTFNFSYPGSNIDFQEFQLNQLLINNNKVPKLIILSIDEPNMLIENSNIVFRYDRLYPLVKYKNIRNELVKRENKSEFISSIFVLYTLKLSQFNLSPKKFSQLDTISRCGSMPISFKDYRFNQVFNTEIIEYDISKESSYLINKFISFINLCNENNIQVIIDFPPIFRERNINFKSRISNLVRDYKNVRIIEIQRPEFSDKSFFFDHTHLKKNGAMIYTDLLIEQIKYN